MYPRRSSAMEYPTVMTVLTSPRKFVQVFTRLQCFNSIVLKLLVFMLLFNGDHSFDLHRVINLKKDRPTYRSQKLNYDPPKKIPKSPIFQTRARQAAL